MSRRWWFVFPWVAVLLAHNIIHECVHYVVGAGLGEKVVEFRFLTNGWGTSQVAFAVPVAERAGAHWLAIALAPAVVTVLIGYLLHLNRQRLVTPTHATAGQGASRRSSPFRSVVNILVWYGAIVFMLLDPFYYGVLSFFTGGDVQASAAVGWPAWPLQAVACAILGMNAWLIVRSGRELTRASRATPAG